VVGFTAVFEADYALLYNASAYTRVAFTERYIASVQAAAKNAIVLIDSVLPGSVCVATRLAFPPAVTAVPGFSCAVGAASECGALLATLATDASAVFAAQFPGVAVRSENVTITLGGVAQAAFPASNAAQGRAQHRAYSVYAVATALLWHL
jgi:hypothetical protein